jgi:hypothetical protein
LFSCRTWDKIKAKILKSLENREQRSFIFINNDGSSGLQQRVVWLHPGLIERLKKEEIIFVGSSLDFLGVASEAKSQQQVSRN